MEAKYMQRGSFCCEAAEKLVSYVFYLERPAMYLPRSQCNLLSCWLTFLTACLPGPRSTRVIAQGEQQQEWVVAAAV